MKVFYKLTLTENQKNKLTVFLIQYAEKAKESAQVWKELSYEEKRWTNKQIETFRSNAEYYQEMFEELQEIKKALDKLPF